MIDVRQLSARLGEFELRDVTFAIPASGYGVVIGPAGLGKTTLLEVIAGVVPARSGTVALADRNVTTSPPDERGAGLVYQHGYLFPHLSVLENLQYGARDEATVQELVQRLEIAPLTQRDVRALSGGERQLVSLARALARRPPVLLSITGNSTRLSSCAASSRAEGWRRSRAAIGMARAYGGSARA